MIKNILRLMENQTVVPALLKGEMNGNPSHGYFC